MNGTELPHEAAETGPLSPMTPEVFERTMKYYLRRSRETGGGTYAVAFALLQLRQDQARQAAECIQSLDHIGEAINRLADILA